VANWLNATNKRQFLIFPLDITTGRQYSGATKGMYGYPILILAEMDTSYGELAEWYAKEIYRIFSNKTTHLMYCSVDENENPIISNDEIGRNKPMIYAYVYHLTRNETYKQWLSDWTDAFWNNRTTENITPGYQNADDFSIPYTQVKEDQHFGRWLLNLEMFYYYTKDSYYKDIIKKVANAVSKWVWYPEKNRFRYFVTWNKPSQCSSLTVHGFSILDLGMINAYLLWGNQTWLEYARRDYDELILKKKILSSHNLIYHAISSSDSVFNPESSWYWNKFAVQAGYMLYLLTKNQTYLESISALHEGAYDSQRGIRGYITKVHADTLSRYPDAKSVSLGEIIHIVYPNLLGDRERYGDAHLANTNFEEIFEEYGEMKLIDPKEVFALNNFRIKNLSEGEYTWNIQVYDIQGREEWGVQRTFSVNIPMPVSVEVRYEPLLIPSKEEWLVYIELPCNDINNINVSSILLNNTVSLKNYSAIAGDWDGDDIPDLMLKFDSKAVLFYILNNINVSTFIEKLFVNISLTLTGNFNNETPFEGNDKIRVILRIIPKGCIPF
jgi:hypothetical protein